MGAPAETSIYHDVYNKTVAETVVVPKEQSPVVENNNSMSEEAGE